MNTAVNTLLLVLIFLSAACSGPKNSLAELETLPDELYPEVLDEKPKLPSPFTAPDGEEYVVALTQEQKYAVIRVTLRQEGGLVPQLIVDTADFPHLARTGLHADASLDSLRTITGRSLAEITALGRPNALSQGGFMAADETILSVLKGDNQLVQSLGFTHPQLAKPLFHVLNMMDTDLSLNRWNMAAHKWENIRHFYYHGQTVLVDAEDTKGGQLSIFDDQIEGGFFIKLWREFEPDELRYLQKNYGHLPQEALDELKTRLSSLNTGEMEPQYIMRYGFYEGHTYWRTDPITIAFIFGLKSLPEIDQALGGDLYGRLTNHYTEQDQ
jgi:hypothetical protein